MEDDSGGPSTFDIGVPRRREVDRFFLVDDYSPLVEPTIHALVEGQLEPGRLQEGIDLLQQTQEVVSAVKRSATRERARTLRNSTRAARDTRRGTAENTISPANSSATGEKDEIASNSRATEMCDENGEGLDSAAAIAFGNLLPVCEKKPIDWCEAQSRDPTARLVIKLLRAKAKREEHISRRAQEQINPPRRSMAPARPV